MNHDPQEMEIVQIEDGEPSTVHDQIVLGAIDRAGDRITSRRSRKSWIAWVVTPTALAASLLLVPYFLLNGPDQTRDLAGNEISDPPNAAELLKIPDRLRWQPQPDATGYRVVLRDIDDKVIFSGHTQHPVSEVTLDDNVVDLLMPGGTYRWVVHVEDSMKNELGPYWFSVKGNRVKVEK